MVQATPETQARLEHENRSLDFVLWFAEQALRCEVVRVPMVLTFPEDFGGDSTEGPSSLWCMQEIRDLEGLHEARRGAGFLCQLAGADQRRPLGILCNLPALYQDLLLGWPVFSQVQEYAGPLPKACPCKIPHSPMVGVSADQQFFPQAGLCSESVSGSVCLQPSGAVKEQFPLRMRWRSELFLGCSSSGSWSSLYLSWAAGNLSKSLLREYSTSERAGDYCSLEALGDLWRFQRSNLLDHCRISTSAGWSSLAASLASSLTTSAVLARPGWLQPHNWGIGGWFGSWPTHWRCSRCFWREPVLRFFFVVESGCEHSVCFFIDSDCVHSEWRWFGGGYGSRYFDFRRVRKGP